MLEYIFGLIAPHLCLGCQKEGAILCADCIRALPPASPCCYVCGRRTERRICLNCADMTPLDGLAVVANYEASAKQLIHRLKFERAAAAARTIAMLMAQEIKEVPKHATVTHAPTATKRVRIRGYDQSKLIAIHLAKELGLPYRPLLLRAGQARQLGTDKQQRKTQMQNAFSARAAHLATDTDIVLVDDVLTTGSTLEAAAAVLKQAGADQVMAVVFAAA